MGGGVIQGQIEEVHFAPIEKEIKGSKIKRNGSVEKPAYLVRSEAGNIALKLHTELHKANGSITYLVNMKFFRVPLSHIIC